MRRALFLMICGGTVLCLATSAGAELFYSEPFDYEPIGDPLAGFGGWQETQPNAPITIVEPGFIYPGYGGEGNAVKITKCCFGTAEHRGPGAALDNLFGTDGTFFVTYLTRQGNNPIRGGLQLIPGAVGPGWISLGGDSTGYRLIAIPNGGGEFQDALGAPLLNTTELMAMRFTIDTFGVDSLDVLRNPGLTGVEDTDWAQPTVSRQEDFSGNTNYIIQMAASLHNDGPGMDEIRICDVWMDCLGDPQAPPVDYSWTNDVTGAWENRANWTPAIGLNWPAGTDAPPGDAGAGSVNNTATFGAAITQLQTVTADTSVSLYAITIDNSHPYIIAGHGRVSLVAGTATSPEDRTGNSHISVAQGTHQFQLKVDLRNDTVVNIARDAALEFVNRLGLNGHTLTKTGEGTLIISNRLSTGGGIVNCNDGTCSGSGTIAGHLNNDGGTISPGIDGGISVVPEPASSVLLALGFAGVLYFGPRRRRVGSAQGQCHTVGGPTPAVGLFSQDPIVGFSEPASKTKIKSSFALTICVAIVLSLIGSADAELFFSDSFNYGSEGDPLAGFGGWEESLPEAPISIIEPGFTYPGYGGGGGAVKIANCCNGDAQHFGVGGDLDKLFGTTGKFFVTYLTQQSHPPHRGGLHFFAGGPGVEPGWVGLAADGTGYRFFVQKNNGLEAQAAVKVDGNPFPLGFGTTEMLAMRFTIDAEGRDRAEVLRNPDLTGDENTDWAKPTARVIGDYSGNTNYFLEMGGAHEGGGPHMDEIRICDVWDDCLTGGFVEPPPAPVDYRWINDITGAWENRLNWFPADGAPPGDDAEGSANNTVTFGDTITQARTVTTNSSFSVHAMTFDNSNSYAIVGGGHVSLVAGTVTTPEDRTGDSHITVVRGSHQFQLKVDLENDTVVNVAEGAELEFVNRLNLNGNTLTKTGTGTLVISNTLNTGNGTVIGADGIIEGSGRISGNFNNTGGILSPGTSTAGDGNDTLSQVPEPANIVALGLGLFVLGLFACRWTDKTPRVQI